MTNEVVPGVGAGFVVFGALDAVADSTEDEDRLPDARASKDLRVRFSPKLKRMVVRPDGNTSVLVSRKPQDVGIGDSGYMVDANEVPGVWLVSGTHEVQLLREGATPISFEVTVTDAHTPDDPLDLASFIPPEPGLDPLPGVPLAGLTVTQAQYDALPGYDPQTVYFVIGAA